MKTENINIQRLINERYFVDRFVNGVLTILFKRYKTVADDRARSKLNERH